MGAIGRSLFLGVLVGSLVGLVPMGSASAAESCEGPLAPWLKCWTSNVEKGKPYVVTLDRQLSLTGSERQRDELLKEDVEKRRHQLVVEVPKNGRTGDGGTALLVLAGGRMVHPDSRIDRIPRWAVEELRGAGVCVPQQLCDQIVETDGPAPPLTGRHLIELGLVADLSTHIEAIAPPVSKAPDPATAGADGRNGEDGADGKADNAAETTDGEAAGYGGAAWTAFWMGLLLALLLLAFVIVIRRSRGPVAVGHRAPGPGWAFGGPARPAPAHATRGGDGGGGDGGGDESTTRLRVAPAPRYGRQVGARPPHARTAVVRTELHPQGYVEVDRVLRRAVWAEPGRPPPAPGGLVDVTDARERDSDVLYAFPPTAARHAKGTPR
ncbi:hypothetical protein [Streptomyces sp. NBC_01314]|uniref:hypothetical protein n=1 Tax=Streptomyces sp. NBC_01314 TaxID=2903821 RepID=UPI0030872265|nr:hypothetical protein OG622_18415 [Streptomyces sp. NBC_01314]